MYLLHKVCFQKKNMATCFKCKEKSLKAFTQQRKPSTKQKDNLQKIFTKDVTDKGLIYKIYKQLI